MSLPPSCYLGDHRIIMKPTFGGRSQSLKRISSWCRRSPIFQYRPPRRRTAAGFGSSVSKRPKSEYFNGGIKMTNFDYIAYWDEHYRAGGKSGAGSYGILGEWKAEIINSFLKTHSVESVVDVGCGDGHMVSLIDYPRYLGFDVSLKSIEICRNLFQDDPNKEFHLYETGKTVLPPCDLVVCLDVLYHITDEKDYFTTLDDIFLSSCKYVVLYTTLEAYKNQGEKPHAGMFHRDTLSHLKKYSGWKANIIKQKYPKGSIADFLILAKEEL